MGVLSRGYHPSLTAATCGGTNCKSLHRGMFALWQGQGCVAQEEHCWCLLPGTAGVDRDYCVLIGTGSKRIVRVLMH